MELIVTTNQGRTYYEGLSSFAIFLLSCDCYFSVAVIIL